MKTVNSFDIFDTLLARTVPYPSEIFTLIEYNYPYKNFKKIRIEASKNSNGTFKDIYKQFQILTNETDENIKKLKKYEFKTEKLNTIPIMSNILNIKDNDIFISDMYLSRKKIRKLLDYHNINSNTKLYVSPYGKKSGEIWEKLTKIYDIKKHTGDNFHSDIIMANKYNIETTFTNLYKFNFLEEYLYKKDFEIFKCLRTLRLQNPYVQDSKRWIIYDKQYEYNIPLLLLMCKKLAEILKNENRNKVLFFSRDGCLIYKIFSYLYPQYKSIYFYSSRHIHKNYNEDYKRYVKENYDDKTTILFDLNGSFKSGRKLYLELFGKLPRVFLFNFNNTDEYYNGITYIFELFFKEQNTSIIQTMNQTMKIEYYSQDMIGSLIDFIGNKPINMPTELNLKYIRAMHLATDNLIKYNKPSIFLNTSIYNDENYWKSYYINIMKFDTYLWEQNHNKNLLTDLANKYNSDKGNKYKCAHYYTIKYQEIISDLLKYKYSIGDIDNIDLLEIGLNRDNPYDIPSLKMWNDYFYKNINITGFDINNKFELFNKKYDNIKIIIGDQSNEEDLKKLSHKQYDIIIDDGLHASKHQQISFKFLWKYLKPNGYYIIEDLHFQPYKEENVIKTKYLFKKMKESELIETKYITKDELKIIYDEIKSINFYDSQSKKWEDPEDALVYIQKK